VKAVEAFTIVLAMVTRAEGGDRRHADRAGGAGSGQCPSASFHHYCASCSSSSSARCVLFGLGCATVSGRRAQAVHDEQAAFREEQEAARQASGQTRFGLDWFGFVVSFKGVLLEGLEVVFIVLTFGLRAQSTTPNAMALAAAGAGAAALLIAVVGAAVRHPLASVPENTMKYAVGLMLTTFGTFWSAEGLGYFGPRNASLEWPAATSPSSCCSCRAVRVVLAVLLLRLVAAAAPGPVGAGGALMVLLR
jgi:putative Mn2+ efflux pump MntP